MVRQQGNIPHSPAGVRFFLYEFRESLVNPVETGIEAEKGRIIPGIGFQDEPGDVEPENGVIRQEPAPVGPLPIVHDDALPFQEKPENHVEPVAPLGLGHVRKESPLGSGNSHIDQVIIHIHSGPLPSFYRMSPLYSSHSFFGSPGMGISFSYRRMRQ